MALTCAKAPFAGPLRAGEMPHIAYDKSDLGASAERTELCAAARKLITDDPDLFQAEGRRLDEEYSIEKVRRRLAELLASAHATASGQPEAQIGWNGRDRTPDFHTVPAQRTGPTAQNERAARIDFAFADLHGRDRQDDERGLLGARRKRTQQLANARRAVLVSVALLDPDAEEYLAGITTLAGCAWLDGDGGEAASFRPFSVYYTWNVQALSMLRRALGVLGVTVGLPRQAMVDGDHNRAEEREKTVSPVVEGAINQFARLLTRSNAVCRAWNDRNQAKSRLPSLIEEPRHTYTQLPESITDFAALRQHTKARRAGSPNGTAHWMNWYDALDELTILVRLWRSALDAASEVLASVERWMDDPRLPPFQRWTATVRGELSRFGGLIHRLTVGDTPESLDTVEFEWHLELVQQRLRELKRVRGMEVPATRASGAVEGALSEDHAKDVPAPEPASQSMSRPEGAGDTDDAKPTTRPAGAEVSDEATLTVSALASYFGVDAEALRKRLERWRRKNQDGWIEAANPQSREAKYLYRVGFVRAIVDRLRASGQASAKRPSGK